MRSNETSNCANGPEHEGLPVSSVSANGTPREAGLFSHPDDVLADASLSRSDKRAILASWASDRRAVENSPALRRLDSGALVGIDEILSAMARLDEPEADRSASGSWRLSFGRRHGPTMIRLPRRLSPRGRDEDDDDPPPSAAVAVPRRPVFTKAVALSA